MYACGFTAFGQIISQKDEKIIIKELVTTPSKIQLHCRNCESAAVNDGERYEVTSLTYPGDDSSDMIHQRDIKNIQMTWDSILFLFDNGEWINKGFKDLCSACVPRQLATVRWASVGWQHMAFCSSDGKCLFGNKHKGIGEDTLKPVKIRPEDAIVALDGASHVASVYQGGKHTVLLTDTDRSGLVDPGQAVPVLRPLPLAVAVKQVSCGAEHVLLLSRIGVVFSFGVGGQGQLGHGDSENVADPKIIGALEGLSMVTLAAGGWHSAAISDIGDLYIWGWNERGQLGFPSSVVQQGSQSDTAAGPGKAHCATPKDPGDHCLKSKDTVLSNVQCSNIDGDMNNTSTQIRTLSDSHTREVGGRTMGLCADRDTREPAQGNTGPPSDCGDTREPAEGTTGPPSDGGDTREPAEGTTGPPSDGGDTREPAAGTTGPPADVGDTREPAEGTTGPPSDGEDTREPAEGTTGPPSDGGEPGGVVTSGQFVNILTEPTLLDIPDGAGLVDPDGTVAIAHVSCGSRHTAAVTEHHKLYTWGWNEYGQLGHGDQRSRDRPTVVHFFNATAVESVFCGAWNTAIITK